MQGMISSENHSEGVTSSFRYLLTILKEEEYLRPKARELKWSSIMTEAIECVTVGYIKDDDLANFELLLYSLSDDTSSKVL